MKKLVVLRLVGLLVILLAVSFTILWFQKDRGDKIEPTRPMAVHFIDVGQGGAALIQKDGKNILYDCGDTFAAPKVEQYLQTQSVTQIDLLVISHAHDDHMGACSRIMQKFPVKKIYHNGSNARTKAWKDFLKAAEAVPEIWIVEKDFTEDGLDIMVAYDTRGKRYSNEADNSILVRVNLGKMRVLLTGDCETPCEKALLKTATSLSAQILNVGHHGAEEASHVRFLEAVRPMASIIQSGGRGNQYGHPAQTVLERLHKVGSAVYRTDEIGTIIIYSDGTKWWLEAKG